MNPHVRRPEEINTEDEALAAVLEEADCYGFSFEDLLRIYRKRPHSPADDPQSRRIREVLWNARKKPD